MTAMVKLIWLPLGYPAERISGTGRRSSDSVEVGPGHFGVAATDLLAPGDYDGRRRMDVRFGAGPADYLYRAVQLAERYHFSN